MRRRYIICPKCGFRCAFYDSNYTYYCQNKIKKCSYNITLMEYERLQDLKGK